MGYLQANTMSVVDAAQYIGIGKNKLYELIKSGNLPHVRIQRCIRIPNQALEDWLARQIEDALPKQPVSQSPVAAFEW